MNVLLAVQQATLRVSHTAHLVIGRVRLLFLSRGRYLVSLHPFLGTAISSLSSPLVCVTLAAAASRYRRSAAVVTNG